MGNCMKTCLQRNKNLGKHSQQLQHQERQESGKTSDTLSKESGTLRVKLILTKDELQWMLLQLKKDKGRNLEQVLGEIEKNRLRVENSVTKWKPCLESIMEQDLSDS